jgi:hypothetical protein
MGMVPRESADGAANGDNRELKMVLLSIFNFRRGLC